MAFELKFYQVTCEYRFAPNLDFYAYLHQIARPFSEDYKHWQTSGLKLNFMNPKDRTSLAIEHNRLAATIDVPTEPGVLVTRFDRAFKEYQKNVKISQFRRVGVRSVSMVDPKFAFEELVGVMRNILLPANEALSQIVGERVKDLTYNIVTEKQGNTVHVVCGPIQKKEISRWYSPAQMITDPGEEMKEIDYPDVALFVDCDCYNDKPTPKLAEDFFQSGLKLATLVPEQLRDLILGH
jgi:hypothetical protein